MKAILSFLSPVLFLFLLLVGCSPQGTDHLTIDSPKAQLFEGMGDHTRTITTSSPEAQAYFNQGLTWMYAFNHEEAIRSFARAAELDPDCAMAWWGIALCEGPNYNDPKLTDERAAAAWGALIEALKRIENTTDAERALILALQTRYEKKHGADRTHLEQAYADAMAAVWETFPDDSDIGTLYAEAIMVQRPWKLYSQNREPEGNTPLIVSTLERVMELDPGNPGANHLYIHAVEPSKDPARGIPAADRLATLVPGAGHLNHMPAHIYIQVNQWDKSIHQNQLAVEADDAYRELSPEQGIQYMYMSHNAHFIAFSGMMSGREAEAMAAARKMWEIIPESVLEGVAPYVDLWMTSVYDVQKRFGRWEALLDEAPPPEYLPITTAIWRAHRAISYAALKDFEGARREQAEFQIAMEAIPEESVFGGDPSHKILKVSEHFIEGEIYLQMEDWEMAIQHLEEAVGIEDTLSYGEPPRWLQPTRHTLGAVYQAAGQPDEAERVFRRDLQLWPGNGWSLFGLQRALAAQGKTKEALEVSRLYETAWAKADEPTTTSCKCLQEI